MLLPPNTRRGGLVEWPYLRVVAKLVCPNGDAHSPYTSHPFWILRLQNACLNQCGDALKCLCAHHLEYLMPNLFRYHSPSQYLSPLLTFSHHRKGQPWSVDHILFLQGQCFRYTKTEKEKAPVLPSLWLF